MSPDRRRRTRLIAATSAALLLAGALVYTSFGAAAQVRTPSQLVGAPGGRSYQVTGKVLPGYVRDGPQLDFRLADRAGAVRAGVMIRYRGVVPDPFRAGREVIVTVARSGSSFVGEPGSLITKCPSKFATAPPSSSSTDPGA
jgi:cytochrome c-type biogenesis protein CcmE